MSWTLLLLLACPLMMLFCMKGMSGGSKNKESKENTKLQTSSKDELQSLQINMAGLMEQNHKLSEEIKSLKGSKSKNSNVS